MASAKPNTTRNTTSMSTCSSSTQVNTTSVTNPLHLASLSTSRHNQISVTRTHSFPKTSLLASLDSHIRMRAHGAASQRLAFSHSRPITNITQAQIRSTQSTSGMSSHQSLAHTVVLPKSPVMSTGYSTSLLQGMANDDSKSQSLPCGISVHQVYHNTQAAVKETLPLANKSSPKSTRKHPLSEKINKRVMMGDDCESSHNNCVRSSDQLQSIMSTNANITPPNVVIGATGGLCQDLTIIKDKVMLSLVNH